MVASIAERHLNPRAAKISRQILVESPIDAALARYCKQKGLDAFVDASTWADDERSIEPDTGPWHFIDIPRGAPKGDIGQYCPASTGCVVSELAAQVRVLRDRTASAQSRADALRYVIHFVGDIHQPLHTTARYNPDPKPGDRFKDDAGGNGVSLGNFGESPWPANLHTFWDEAYRRYYEDGVVKASPSLNPADGPGNPEIKEWLKKLDLNVTGKLDTHFDVKKWVMESHEIACTQVYGTLGAPYGVKGVKLSEEYVKQGTNTARHQLVVAGYRLAALLNDLYGK